MTGLQSRADTAGLIGWDVSVDSTIVRAHQHAASARNNAMFQAEPPDAPVGGAESDDHGDVRQLARRVDPSCTSPANRATER